MVINYLILQLILILNLNLINIVINSVILYQVNILI